MQPQIHTIFNTLICGINNNCNYYYVSTLNNSVFLVSFVVNIQKLD